MSSLSRHMEVNRKAMNDIDLQMLPVLISEFFLYFNYPEWALFCNSIKDPAYVSTYFALCPVLPQN